MNIQKNILLKDYLSFKIGGPAQYFAKVSDLKDLQDTLAWAKTEKQPLTILGGGTNMLVSDQGIKGLVLKLDFNQLEFQANKVKVGCGVPLAFFLNRSLEENLVGLEFAAGVPGTVGGAIRGNAGTYGVAMDSIVKKISYLDENNELKEMEIEQANFAYRHSIFKEKKDWIIIEAKIELAKGDVEKARLIVQERLQYRKDTQPNEPSAGCIFKNVKFDESDIEALKARKIEVEKFEKFQKIPAAYLIEKAGLKGHSIGGAKVSEKHANYIINNNQATFEQVIMLISFIKQQIRDKYGIQLIEEVQIFV